MLPIYYLRVTPALLCEANSKFQIKILHTLNESWCFYSVIDDVMELIALISRYSSSKYTQPKVQAISRKFLQAN